MKKHNYYLIVGIIITAVILAITIIGQFWTPYDITGMNGTFKNQAPSLAHIMGTDNFGRDVFSRVIASRCFCFVQSVSSGCELQNFLLCCACPFSYLIAISVKYL